MGINKLEPVSACLSIATAFLLNSEYFQLIPAHLKLFKFASFSAAARTTLILIAQKLEYLVMCH